MTKKYKLLLSGSALAATAAIVPLSIVACGSTEADKYVEISSTGTGTFPASVQANSSTLPGLLGNPSAATNSGIVSYFKLYLRITLNFNEVPEGTQPFYVSKVSIDEVNATDKKMTVTLSGIRGNTADTWTKTQTITWSK